MDISFDKMTRLNSSLSMFPHSNKRLQTTPNLKYTGGSIIFAPDPFLSKRKTKNKNNDCQTSSVKKNHWENLFYCTSLVKRGFPQCIITPPSQGSTGKISSFTYRALGTLNCKNSPFFGGSPNSAPFNCRHVGMTSESGKGRCNVVTVCAKKAC